MSLWPLLNVGGGAMTKSGVVSGAWRGLMDHPVDWLAAMLISWVVPLGFFGRPSTYFTSLWFWLVPVLLLLPRFYMSTNRGGRRRRAFWLTVVFVFVAGIVL